MPGGHGGCCPSANPKEPSAMTALDESLHWNVEVIVGPASTVWNMHFVPFKKSASAEKPAEKSMLAKPVGVGQLTLGSHVKVPATTVALSNGNAASQPVTESVKKESVGASRRNVVTREGTGGNVVVVVVVLTRHATSPLARHRRTNFKPGVFTTLLPTGTATGTGQGGHGLGPLHRKGQRSNVQTPSRLPSVSQAGSLPRRHPSIQVR